MLSFVLVFNPAERLSELISQQVQRVTRLTVAHRGLGGYGEQSVLQGAIRNPQWVLRSVGFQRYS